MTYLRAAKSVLKEYKMILLNGKSTALYFKSLIFNEFNVLSKPFVIRMTYEQFTTTSNLYTVSYIYIKTTIYVVLFGFLGQMKLPSSAYLSYWIELLHVL